MLRYFGADNVRVLNGGLKKWQAEDRDVVGGPVKAVVEEDKSGDYSFNIADSSKCILDIAVMHDLAGKLYHAGGTQALDFQILDARSAGRFEGKDPEPRKNCRGGSIKNSINVPFTALLDADGTLKSNDELAGIFESRGVDLAKSQVTSCGSGVTACVVDLALRVSGHEHARMYDGSWSEYGSVEEPKF